MVPSPLGGSAAGAGSRTGGNDGSEGDMSTIPRRDPTRPAVGRRGGPRRRPAPAARVLLALLLGAVALAPAAGCGGDDGGPPPSAEPAEMPEQQIYDYLLTESEDGVKDWQLASHRMEKYADRQDVELYDLTMDFFEEGRYFSTLTADRGRANLDTKELFAWGNVVVVTEDGRRLETEQLHYDDQRRLIHNDVFNRLTWRDDVVTGYGLEATPDLEYVEIKKQVRAGVDAREEEKEP